MENISQLWKISRSCGENISQLWRKLSPQRRDKIWERPGNEAEACPQTLLIKMAEVTLIDFSYLDRLALSTCTGVGAQFSNQDSRLEPVKEKAKKPSTLQYPRSISVTSAVLSSTVSDLLWHGPHKYHMTSPPPGPGGATVPKCVSKL